MSWPLSEAADARSNLDRKHRIEGVWILLEIVRFNEVVQYYGVATMTILSYEYFVMLPDEVRCRFLVLLPDS